MPRNLKGSVACIFCGLDTVSRTQICTRETCRNEYEKAIHKDRHHYMPIKYMYTRTKARAKYRGIEFSITEEMIEIPERCPILGIELKTHFKGWHDSSPALDRINPKLGYVPGNVQVISTKANQMKSNATPEELKQFSRYFIGDGSN